MPGKLDPSLSAPLGQQLPTNGHRDPPKNPPGVVPMSNGMGDPEAPAPSFANPAAYVPDRRGIFPCRPCKSLPASITAIVPPTFQAIQDFTHLCLLSGLIGALLLLASAGQQLLHMQLWNFATFAQEIYVMGVIIPCIPYIFKIIGTYDQQIHEKQTVVADLKLEVTNSYEDLITSIDHLLGQAAESSATMAERSFESKRRDFIRFLERADKYKGQMALTPVEEAELVKQFRTFVLRWLTVFKECSVDPVNAPKLVVSEADLEKCRTVEDIAKLVIERLRNTEVKFISDRRAEDQKAIQGLRKHHKRLSGVLQLPGPLPYAAAASVQPVPQEIELAARPHARLDDASSDSSDGLGGDSPRRVSPPNMMPVEPQTSFRQVGPSRWRCALPCHWLRLGRYGCSGLNARRRDYPREFQCTCLLLVILSKEHLMLMTGFCGALGILLWEYLECKENAWIPFPYMLPALVYIISIAVLLIRFEDVDIVQRLAREVSELEQERQFVQERREKMVTFWSELGQLTALWVHRTVPRLDLLKEVQGHLEYSKPEDTLHLMAGANSRLEELERRLPELQSWREDGGLSEDSKKEFAQGILTLCKEDNLPSIIHGLNRFIENGLPAIDSKPRC